MSSATTSARSVGVTADDQSHGRLQADGALLFLSAASGAVDAFAFICLGKVFAGVMTGNLILIGASLGSGGDRVAFRAGTTLLGYVAGAAYGAWLTEHTRGRWRTVLTVETALLVAVAVVWAAGLGGSGWLHFAMLAAVSLAMGIQGSVCLSPTNYITGTLTTLAGHVGNHVLRPADRWVGGRLLAIVAGAAITALVERLWSPGTGLVAVPLMVFALVVEAAARRRAQAE
ncbi:YoaK family protein [Streptomyces sp. NPDC057654]|uniref:YoaK family protein n=1 Tax=Streptomyces sp. NPDC057654 TaxID=3346196 RepID=UPI0036774049